MTDKAMALAWLDRVGERLTSRSYRDPEARFIISDAFREIGREARSADADRDLIKRCFYWADQAAIKLPGNVWLPADAEHAG